MENRKGQFSKALKSAAERAVVKGKEKTLQATEYTKQVARDVRDELNRMADEAVDKGLDRIDRTFDVNTGVEKPAETPKPEPKAIEAGKPKIKGWSKRL